MSVVLGLNDFKKVCRACTSMKNDLKSVYTDELIEMFCALTQILIIQNDGLPGLICSECLSEIERFNNFKKLCIRSDLFFHKILSDVNEKKSDDVLPDQRPSLADELEHQVKNEGKDYESYENDADVKSDSDAADDSYQTDFKEDWPSEEDISMEILNSSESKQKRETANKLRVKKAMMMGPDKCDPATFTCKICNKVLVNINSLARHMEVHDENRKFNFTCGVCDKGFYEKGQLTKHMRRHRRETRYECEECSKGFYELSALAVHMKSNHKMKPIGCDLCKKQFYVRLQLDIHKKTHSTEKEHVCNKCGKSFHLPYQLKNHQFAHRKESLYPCLLCDKIFKYPVSLKKHHNTFHVGGNDIKPEVCAVCGKAVKFLNSHMVRIHSEDRPYKCPDCPAAYVYKSQLEEHRQVKHDKIRKYPYLCSMCGKPCQTTTELRRHTRRHTGERPFECTHCDKKYKTNAELSVHVRSHTGERPYVCPVCRKGFYTSQILKHHVRTHTGERPHECEICGRAFTQNSALKTHMRVH